MSNQALAADHASARRSAVTPALWRVAGGLAIAHVVLLFAGFSQEESPVHGDSAARVGSVFRGRLHRTIAGGYVESLAFIVLLPGLVSWPVRSGNGPRSAAGQQ